MYVQTWAARLALIKQKVRLYVCMYVCKCVCIYVFANVDLQYNMNIYVYVCTHISCGTSSKKFVCVYVCICVCVCVCMYVCMCSCMQIGVMSYLYWLLHNTNHIHSCTDSKVSTHVCVQLLINEMLNFTACTAKAALSSGAVQRWAYTLQKYIEYRVSLWMKTPSTHVRKLQECICAAISLLITCSSLACATPGLPAQVQKLFVTGLQWPLQLNVQVSVRGPGPFDTFSTKVGMGYVICVCICLCVCIC